MRPYLFYFGKLQQGDSRPLIVDDLAEALRRAQAHASRVYTNPPAALWLSRSWWLFAGWSEGEAFEQVLQYCGGSHPRQHEIADLYAQIQAGGNPPLDLLFEDDVLAHIPCRDRPTALLFYDRKHYPCIDQPPGEI